MGRVVTFLPQSCITLELLEGVRHEKQWLSVICMYFNGKCKSMILFIYFSSSALKFVSFIGGLLDDSPLHW